MLLPIYFRDTNISRGNIIAATRNGDVAPIARGVYIGLPSKALNAEKQAAIINDTLTKYANRITARIFPTAIMIYRSAFLHGMDNDRHIFLTGSKNGAATIGAPLEDTLAPEVWQKIKPITIEMSRMKRPIPERRGIDYTEVYIDDGLLDNPAIWHSESLKQKGERELKADVMRLTSPEKTLLDLARCEEEPHVALKESEFQGLLQIAGLPHHQENALKRIPLAIEEVKQRFPGYPKKTYHYLEHRLQRLAKEGDLTPQINENKKQAINEFSLRWFGSPLARIIQRKDDNWVFHYEQGWALPIWKEDTNKKFPVFLSNLFPESRKITPSERVAFLKEHNRLMSNLTIVDVNDFGRRLPDDRMRYTLTEVNPENKDVYTGKITGVPVYDETFDRKTRQIMWDSTLTQISGAQIKIPTHLGKEYIRPADNSSFTHILKIPMGVQYQSLGALEWVGMTMARDAGLKVPDFRMVDLTAIEKDSFDEGRYQKDRHAINQVLPQLAASTAKENTLDDESKIKHLSQAMNENTDGLIADKGFWSDVFHIVGDGGGIFDSALDPKKPAPPALLVERFDIPTPQDPRWRLAEDFCSLTHRIADDAKVKYAGTMEEVAKTLKEESSDWNEDRHELFKQTVIHNLVLNNDAHLKNYSILRIAKYDLMGFDSVRLSPAYDITAAGVLTDGNNVQALSINRENKQTRESLIQYGMAYCEMYRHEAENSIDLMASNIIGTIKKLKHTMPNVISRDPILLDEVNASLSYAFAACHQYSPSLSLKNDGPCPL